MKHLTIYILLIIMCSCSNYHSNEPLQYRGFSMENLVHCNGEQINSSFSFMFPAEMLLTDSLIIVMSPQGSTQIFHLFEKSSGKHLKSIGSRGRGLGEVILPEAMFADKENNLLHVYDKQFRKLISYDLAKVAKKSHISIAI